MNKRLLILGTVSAFVWAFVSRMSFGLPLEFCAFLDRLTFHLFTEQIFEMSYGFYYDVNNNNMPTRIFLILFFVNFLFMLGAMRFIERNPQKTSNGSTIIGIVFFAVVFRLFLLPSVLIHENDIYRYLWDGKSIKHGINPFKYAPADLFMYEHNVQEDYYDDYYDVTIKHRVFNQKDAHRLNTLITLRDQNATFYNRIGHWEVPTIYPPVAQAVFALSAVLKEDSLIFMKGVFVLFDIGVIVLIIFLLKHFGRNPAMSLVYAWSPLVLKEYANSGHYDPVAIFFTLLALLLFFKMKELNSSGVLALATLSKFFSGILLPLLFKPRKINCYFLFGAIAVVSYIPFVIWDSCGIKQVFLGLHTYNEQWSYNSSVFAVVYRLIDTFIPTLAKSYFPAKIVVGLVYLGLIARLYFHREQAQISKLYKCFIAIAGLFILNPVGDPWYFCWSIPFLCFFPFRSWMLLSGLLILSYLHFHSDLWIVQQDFLDISLLSWIIYMPFFVYLAIELWKKPEYLQIKDC